MDRWIHAEDSHILIFWPDAGAFRIEHGRRIVVEPAAQSGRGVLRLFLLGTAIAIALHQRGLAVFHAASVAIDGQGVIFVGKKGAGKSSMAAALHALGHPVLSDDLAVMDPQDPLLLIQPGFPRLKLWPDAVELLCRGARTYLLREGSAKLGVCLPSGLPPAPPPLRAVVVLDEGPQLSMQALPPRPALMELLGHYYGARFGHQLYQVLGPERHLAHCAQVIEKAGALRFSRPNAIDDLKTQAQFAVDELRRCFAENGQ